MAQQVKNPESIHEDDGSMPGLAQWVKEPTKVADLDLVLLWLWYRLAVADLIRPLA